MPDPSYRLFGLNPHRSLIWCVQTDVGTTEQRRPAENGAASQPDPDRPIVDLATALHDVYRTHFAELVRTARVLLDTPEAAQDAVHDAFVATFRRDPRLQNHRQLHAYLRTAVLNRARSVLRTRRTGTRAVQLLEAVAEHTVDDAEAAVTAQETDQEVLDALRSLPARQQQVLIHRFLHARSGPETAAALGISESAVRSVQVRALRTLRTLLGDHR